jgi:hypothetical protein
MGIRLQPHRLLCRLGLLTAVVTVALGVAVAPIYARVEKLYVKDLQSPLAHVTAGSRLSIKVAVSNDGSSNGTTTTLKMWLTHGASGTSTMLDVLSAPGSPPPTQTRCDYYASQGGTGSGMSVSTPFRVRNFFAIARPGKTLCLLDGTYQGAESMIAPSMYARGVSGNSSAPITVKALNDGAVTIDGQFVRRPVSLNDNSWWVFEGFNAKNGANSSTSCTATSGTAPNNVIHLTNGSNNNIFRRIVAWDACIAGNSLIIGMAANSSNNLFEDVAAFGTARKIFQPHGGSNNNTCRRCWFRWEGSLAGSAMGALGMTMFYKATGGTFENILVTWSGESMPETYTDGAGRAVTNFDVPSAGGILTVDRLESTTTPKHADISLRGSISYTKATDRLPSLGNGAAAGVTISGVRIFGASRITLTDVVRVMSPRHPRFNQHLGFALTRREHNCVGLHHIPSASGCEDPVIGNSATRLTSIRGTHSSGNNVGDSFGTNGVSGRDNETDWTVTGVSAGTSLAAVQSPWQNTSMSGARLCYRWGTTTPLWPWPMNERIKAATAAAGVYRGPCPTCVGGRGVRTTTDVTADIEELLGTIPTSCRR